MEGSVIKRKINFFLLFIPIVLFHSAIIPPVMAQARSVFGSGFPSIEGPLVFVLAAASLIPLAGFVESAVEELAELLGPFIGGLLHTTFGNVAELTIGLSVLLYAGKEGPTIVLGSIAGVIIRNSLLFLGLSTVLGCLRNGHMKFNAENASEYSTVFALAVVGLSLPTIAAMLSNASNEDIPAFGAPLSVYVAVVLVISYLAYIGFAVFRIREGSNLVEMRIQRRLERLQLRPPKRQQRRTARSAAFPLSTQTDTQALFIEEREQAERRLEGLEGTEGVASATTSAPAAVAIRTDIAPPGMASPERKRIYAKAALLEHKRQVREERGERGFLANHRIARGLIAVLVLAIATAGVAAMSENFAKSIESLVKSNGLAPDKEFFLGLILIPIVAGIVELYGSVDAARHNRMEITMAVTAGASVQMILLIVPILVLVGQFTGHPLALVFQPLEIITFGAATFIYMLLSRDGESTWLEGAQLCSLWLLVAATALFVHVGG